MRRGTFARAARKRAAPPKVSKEVQACEEDLAPLPTPANKKGSRASVLPGSTGSRDTKPGAPEYQKEARTPFVTCGAVVHAAPQSHEGSVCSRSEPPEENMDCILPVLQSPVSSASTDTTGRVEDSSKKEPIPRVTAPNEAEDLR